MENNEIYVTEHFKLSEFACKNGASVPLKYQNNVYLLAKQLEVVRAHLGAPIVINSGYRTPEYNAKVGGVPNSQHLTASAADITIKGYSPYYVFRTMRMLMREGLIHGGCLIQYRTFVHYDIRGGLLFLDKT